MLCYLSVKGREIFLLVKEIRFSLAARNASVAFSTLPFRPRGNPASE